jgi:hypothetical protein
VVIALRMTDFLPGFSLWFESLLSVVIYPVPPIPCRRTIRTAGLVTLPAPLGKRRDVVSGIGPSVVSSPHPAEPNNSISHSARTYFSNSIHIQCEKARPALWGGWGPAASTPVWQGNGIRIPNNGVGDHGTLRFVTHVLRAGTPGARFRSKEIELET